MSMEGPVFNMRTIDNLGSIEIACFIGLVLFGVGILQAYTYFQRFSNDQWFIKALVL